MSQCKLDYYTCMHLAYIQVNVKHTYPILLAYVLFFFLYYLAISSPKDCRILT